MTIENAMKQSPQFEKCDAERLLSIVVPAYNEVEVLPTFHQRLEQCSPNCHWQRKSST